MKLTKPLLLAALSVVCLLSLPLPSLAQDNPPQVGLFFDQSGTACNANTEPFDPSPPRAHILAFVDPGVELAGVLLRLELPPFLAIENIQFPKNTNVSGEMTAPEGLDLQFQVCPVSNGAAITLASFDIEERNPDLRQDLKIKVVGGTITAPDTLTLKEPNLKICDPNDPNGYAELLVAPGTIATLNCSTGDCPCNETALLQQTWTAVRKLYADD